ncbi:hypothetical protein F442_19243 [Phytophthora nicotianae P10297]|uniref:Uncharacterized protein n=3 Tax=Phytophthora nicotianae TaxID=4792 RepID=W2QZJ7_PHYN3|nr:hypothetical protein PPTG_21703 [Phytophthora nicotianae INRA-310]ETN17869.1 hypothetical protein PPTG_21703 [Phytophthora nicotianae INRA-310]ETO62731.1 hypothetical protein F444_19425 [Phytophthora nicotianae P1976]ETP31976.1 hypothetical protein F442_19243 [Phytophthora nicotianae P10297]
MPLIVSAAPKSRKIQRHRAKIGLDQLNSDVSPNTSTTHAEHDIPLSPDDSIRNATVLESNPA